jgi:hypothetical protein
VGFEDVRTSPELLSIATHNEVEGHDMASSLCMSCSVGGSTAAGTQAGAPPEGFVDVKILPALSTATHSEIEGHERPVSVSSVSPPPDWKPCTISEVDHVAAEVIAGAAAMQNAVERAANTILLSSMSAILHDGSVALARGLRVAPRKTVQAGVSDHCLRRVELPPLPTRSRPRFDSRGRLDSAGRAYGFRPRRRDDTQAAAAGRSAD